MVQSFAERLDFVLKVLSITRSQLAAGLGVDKSIVGRWITGAVRPSSHNLARLTALVATHAAGFTMLDWERDLDGLAQVLGLVHDGGAASVARRPAPGLPLPLMDQILATTARRGDAYEGFFRTTRPYAQKPGRFVHDHILIRRDEAGLLRFDMGSAGVVVEGYALLLEAQVFVIASELTSGAMAFGILNGVNTVRAGAIDGLILTCALDPGRTPTASPIVLERTGDLTDDPAADQARFADLARSDNLAPEDSVPAEIRAHLARDIGPAQLAAGGDWLLRLPLARSLSGGLQGS